MNQYKIIYFDEIPSTNDYALENLKVLADKQVILAEKQTKGHGRFKRKWISHVPQNIYMSLVLKPCLELDEAIPLVNISQYMSLIICEVLESYGVQAELKWPNDILVNKAKICGLLSKTSITGNCLNGYILGIGINLNMSPADLLGIDQNAASLNLITGTPINRDKFLNLLLEKFFKKYDWFLKNGFISIKEKYTQKSAYLGKIITIRTMESAFNCLAKGFSNDGALIIETENGKTKEIVAGEIIL